ncbi:MAG: hypothetical protein HC880_13920 [Bacteroidia bacterium]|nr:hypothetical protein [Bacteroidia bacterium]
MLTDKSPVVISLVMYQAGFGGFVNWLESRKNIYSATVFGVGVVYTGKIK